MSPNFADKQRATTALPASTRRQCLPDGHNDNDEDDNGDDGGGDGGKNDARDYDNGSL